MVQSMPQHTVQVFRLSKLFPRKFAEREKMLSKNLLSVRRRVPDTLFATTRHFAWVPSHVSDLDKFATDTLDAGAELESNHPGFHDALYRQRRENIVSNAKNYRFGEEIPRVNYSQSETDTWRIVYRSLSKLWEDYACREFKQVMPLMEKHCGYAEDNIPQLEDISIFLRETTGFRLRPVSGLLTARDFLNALAFRTFFSTQYIRHSSTPLYTPEPDICHELLGHVPMLADRSFADFSQQIGLASLGASDEEIEKLASCYWFSVEFGLLKEGNTLKAYGAGLLSSFGELVYSCTGEAEGFAPARYLNWEPQLASSTQYPITTYQPVYFVAESLVSAEEKMRRYCKNITKEVDYKYSHSTESVQAVPRRSMRRSKSTMII